MNGSAGTHSYCLHEHVRADSTDDSPELAVEVTIGMRPRLGSSGQPQHQDWSDCSVTNTDSHFRLPAGLGLRAVSEVFLADLIYSHPA